MPAITPIRFIRTILLGYQRYACTAETARVALQKAQISASQLTDPDATVSALQMERFSALAMQDMNDEALGWYTRPMLWGSYGLLCRASLSSGTLGLALQRWCRHHRLLCDDIVLELQSTTATPQPGPEKSKLVTLNIHERRDLGPFRELCLVTTLRYFLGYACWLINSRIVVERCSFPFDAPSYIAYYERLFHAPVQAGAAQASITFSAKYLDFAPVRDEAALQTMLKRALYLTVHNYQKDRLLQDRVREHLRRLLTGGTSLDHLTLPHIAAHFHLSKRSLARHLQEEGGSWQSLKNTARLEYAEQRLQHEPQLAIKRIASSVGFQNEKSFSRAFLQWKGISPGAWRREQDRHREAVTPY